MALKATCYITISIAVLFHICSAVNVTVEDIDVVEGFEARITCNIVKNDPNNPNIPAVEWYKITNGGDDLIAAYQGNYGSVQPSYSDRFSVEGDITLVIANTQPSDNGTYKCDVSLGGDNPPSAKDTFTLTVNYTGVVLISITSRTEPYFTMTCVGDGNPDPLMELNHNGSIIKASTTMLTYTQDRVTETNDGVYHCIASNNAGTVKSDNLTLDYYKPDYDLAEKMTVLPNQLVTIQLDDSSANPNNVTHKWTIDNPDIEDTDDNQATFSFKASEIHGTVYIITVNCSNAIGSTPDVITVTVTEDDNNGPGTGLIVALIVVGILFIIGLGIFVFCLANRKISVKVIATTADVSTEVLIEISITLPSKEHWEIIDWYKSDEHGTKGAFIVRSGDSNTRCSVTEDGHLKIPTVKESDGGFYLCIIKTTSGKIAQHHSKLTINQMENKNGKSSLKTKNSDQAGVEHVEMEGGKTPLVRYEASGGELYTQVNIQHKKPKSKPAQVDKPVNAEGLLYADLDLTKNLPRDEIHHPDADTTYASIQQPTRI